MLTTVVTPMAPSTARVMRDMSWMMVDRSAMVCITGPLEAPQGWSGHRPQCEKASHTEAEKNYIKRALVATCHPFAVGYYQQTKHYMLTQTKFKGIIMGKKMKMCSRLGCPGCCSTYGLVLYTPGREITSQGRH